MTIRYDGKVAIITGAGNGLGKSHALALAKRGCKVVINDLGSSVDGVGSSNSAAEDVVAEIIAAGGEAISNSANVTSESDVAEMVRQTMEKWGRIDILINNAGILRDKSFHKMDISDFQTVIDVHLMGAAICTQAVWPIMRKQNYGRIVCTSSPSGLHGIFGQANYAAAKAGMIGFMNALHLEGASKGITINLLAPAAKTRMTDNVGVSLPSKVLDQLTPESITAAALFLVSEEAPSKAIVSCAAGGYARAYIVETEGVYLPPEQQTPEAIAESWDAISLTDNLLHHDGMQSVLMKFVQKAM